MEKELKRLKLDTLSPAAWNPRSEAELAEDNPAMKELVASVRAVGVIQPIDVWIDDGLALGIVLAGNRRVKAATLAGLKEVPAMVFKGITEAQAHEITRIENEVRSNVDPMRDAALIGEMLALGFNQKEIAARFGVSEARICRRRKLLDLCPKIREHADSADSNITIDALEHIAVYPLEIQEACAKDIINRAKQSSIALRWNDVSHFISGRTKDLNLVKFDTCQCRECTLRTGVMPDLFGGTEEGKLGRCLSPNCFNSKFKEWAVGKLKKKFGSVIVVDAKESGIECRYTVQYDANFGEKKTKSRPALWYWVDQYSPMGASWLFGPTLEEYKRLKRKKAEADAKAEKEAKAKVEMVKAKEAERRGVLKERDDLVGAVEKAVAAVVDKAWKKVDYTSWSKNQSGVKLLDDALRKYLKDTAQRTALAKLLVTCFDCDIGIDDEVVAFCGAFPDFAKKCGIKNEDFTAITQARASLEKFYKEHSDLKPSED